MIRGVVQSALAVVAGLAVAFILAMAVEVMGLWLHPFPPGVDPMDPEVCRAHVARYPAGPLFLASLGWGATVLAGSWVAARLGTRRHPAHGIAVGLLLLSAAVANMLMLPYPWWFWASNLILLPLGLIAGSLLARPRAA